MAGMDGPALLNQVRERWPLTPVILMAGRGSNQEGLALCNGAFAFIEKPLNLDRLVSLLNAAISKSDLHLRLREANRESHMGFCVATQP
jgi:DNA-binding NtrC family response regulator